MVHDFTKFDAWQKAMALADHIHELTKSFPKSETFGMIDQMRRASISVAANIAEGFGRYTAPDKRHKYVQARGELIEVMTFLYHAERVRYIDKAKRNHLLTLASDVHKMLNALIARMNELSPP